MNEQSMHDYFRRQELRMNNAIPEDQIADNVTVTYDGFVKSKSGLAFGFYLTEDFLVGNERNWTGVVWVPKTMIEAELVSVERLEHDKGFVVTMPVWFANRKGVI